ncbi:MAG: phosphate regulon sensor histidine kinase PhoR [Rhodocyclaceae bacterium]|nr:phosphate regulon sensor histidine kinase PhoR [Rhodocyclaceae bacterium]MBX3668132.1 phosphate regulon sensor histidine kinase PhoR [Rhodocyclaceae bacterium]
MPLREEWIGWLTWLGVFAMLGAAIYLVSGSMAWVFGCATLLAAWGYGYELWRRTQLLRWLEKPGPDLPDAGGTWENLFGRLRRLYRKNTEEVKQARHQLARVRAVTHAMPDGTVVLNAADEIEWFNSTAEMHLQLDPKRDLGQPIVNLVRAPEFHDYLRAGGYNAALTLRAARGRILEVQCVRFGDDQKLLLTRDVTKLERLETMRRDFVANVSHELKTPLTVIGGFLETLDDALAELPPPAVQRYVRLAREQSQRMERLVQDLLTLSALENGRVLPKDEEIDMSALCADLLHEAEALSGGRHSITLELADERALRGAPEELRSAFANLLSNAVRYTPAGGRISAQWRTGPQGAEFVVSDTGIGVAEEHLPRITERFYRVDGSRSRETGGTGLGLAIVKHVLERHHGRLLMESEIGKGSRFTARLPLTRLIEQVAG